jgi:hypothetical protein
MFKNIIKQSLYFLIMLLTFTSCKTDNPVDVNIPSASVLLPLDEGNSWTFMRTVYNPNGSVNYTDTITQKIVKDSSLYGFKWSFESYEQVLYQNDEQGLWIFYTEPRLYYRYPSLPNVHFVQNYDTVTVVSTDTLITTPAGEFHCYHYRINFDNYPINQFICPDLGFVNMEYGYYYSNPPGWVPYLSVRLELLSYNIKK